MRARTLAKRDDVPVILIDKNNYHRFQPLLYQLATAELSTKNAATSQCLHLFRAAVGDNATLLIEVGGLEITLRAGINASK